MMQIDKKHAMAAVQAVAEMIAGRVERSRQDLDESQLRYELVACLLSSRVRYEDVDAAMKRLEADGLLEAHRWHTSDLHFEWEVGRSLKGRSQLGDRAYRFARLRARQMTALRAQLSSQSLTRRIRESKSMNALRAELVAQLPGIGPKQASMFIRNTALSWDVAIIDSHVLEFMRIVGLVDGVMPVGRLANYESIEALARQFARKLRHEVGILDWAIWVTMRAARELKL